MESSEIERRNLIGEVFAWAVSVLVSLICLFVGLVLSRTTPVFRELFQGLGVELPLTTRFLIANYFWLYPSLFGGLAILSIVKEFRVRGTRRRLSASGIILLAAISSVGLERFIMYLPLLDLIQKLNQAK
jgi:type II secretory pathway component PulF